MNSPDNAASTNPPYPASIIVQTPKESFLSRMLSRAFYVLFGFSVLLNITLLATTADYFGIDGKVKEKYHSGSKTNQDKLVVIAVEGLIAGESAENIIEALKKAKEDEEVKGVLLNINSPGGMVTSSHQIYHELEQLRAKKPVYAIMEDIAASGGYYIAMGTGKTGKIFAEPTTWTGSIGVILPHYQAEELAEKLGIKSNPITTGQFKDSLSMFRPMSEEDQKLWANIIDQAFQRFLRVIVENRPDMPLEKLKPLAQGQVFTADDAMKNGLIDQIGFEEDALSALKTDLKLTDPRIVKYEYEQGLASLLTSVKTDSTPVEQFKAAMELSAPRAMYLFTSFR